VASEYTVQTNPFAVYDTAVRDFVATTVVGDDGKSEDVPIVFATPRKEFANQKVLGKKDKPDPITRTKAEETPRQQRTVPYPTMGVIRLSPVFNWLRFRPLLERKLQITDRNRSWLQARYALPWDVQYQIDMRAKYRTHLNQMVNNMMLKFVEPMMPLRVDWGAPYGVKRVFLGIDQITDNSVLETNNSDEDRTLRATVTLRLEAWFIQKITQTPTALRIFEDAYVVTDFNEDLTGVTPDFSVEIPYQGVTG